MVKYQFFLLLCSEHLKNTYHVLHFIHFLLTLVRRQKSQLNFLDARADIIDVFALENELCNLNLADFNVKNSHLIAISRSVAGHSKLSKIDLTGNFLGKLFVYL